MEELLYWIANAQFKKEESCNCDFNGDWLGYGICIGCRHPVDYFIDDSCTYPVLRSMSAQEMKQTIIAHITETLRAEGKAS